MGEQCRLERGDRAPPDRGIHSRRAAEPVAGLKGDAGTIADLLRTIKGPIVLVGHSYGGAVITNAATGNRNVKALVYVDAFAPAKGESVLALDSTKPGPALGAGRPGRAAAAAPP
ncbi:MAG TPA: alpha/beta fold hydrolase [Solirubrobacteraceae bacterium]